MDSTRAEVERGAVAESRRVIENLRAAVSRGEEHWFLALLEAIRRWPLPSEQVGERAYQYLVGGEAFDWLLLAERLCDELEGLVPADETEALLFHEDLPLQIPEDEFRQLLGAKYSAHLNFVYGVRVEGALQLAVQDEVFKERTSTYIWENGAGDDETFRRLYGQTRLELVAEFRDATNGATEHDMSLHELVEFRYWLFRRRVQGQEPARVASDTRKGLAMVQRMDLCRKRRKAAPPNGADEPGA